MDEFHQVLDIILIIISVLVVFGAGIWRVLKASADLSSMKKTLANLQFQCKNVEKNNETTKRLSSEVEYLKEEIRRGDHRGQRRWQLLHEQLAQIQRDHRECKENDRIAKVLSVIGKIIRANTTESKKAETVQRKHCHARTES